ncbi:hypothetical protein ACERIT_10195 [Halopenitus sp. H-Gu1]|uniref:DUF7845 domain-containing protein n=1 Tax=Halopenitus sp. H-Gu1 TaxID=3242697 RepID=UPI00359E2279
MSTDRPGLARSRRLGETSESAVLDLVPQLEPVSDTENPHVDARMRGAFTPSSELDSAGLLIIEDGTLVEIKSVSVVYGEGQRRGRFHFRETQHEYLAEHGGVYLLAVCAPHSRDVLAATLAPPNAVGQELIETWSDTDGREPYSKVAWSRVFDPDEMRGDLRGSPPPPADDLSTASPVRRERRARSDLPDLWRRHRLMLLLADEKGTRWEYKADNTDVIGYRHAIELEPSAVEQIVPDHATGVRLKSYHPKHARREETGDDPLSSPKFGCAFHRKIDGDTREWRDRDELQRQLEELLVNVLRWADVPTDPDPTAYVADDHFEVTGSDQEIAGLSDPTPQLEAQQESVLMSVLGELTPTARDATEVLATDGGRMHYEELAEKTDSSVSTIYRVLERFGEIVESDRGMVKFTSQKIRQEIVGMVDRLEELKESTAERVAELANVDLRSRADSALEKWMARYGATLVDVDGDERTLRFDTLLSKLKCVDEPRVEDVLQEGLEAWISTGRDRLQFLELRVDAKIRGQRDLGGVPVGSIIDW